MDPQSNLISEPPASLAPLTANSSTELVPAALDRVLASGHRVNDSRPFLEVLNQALCQHDVRRRVLSAIGSSFNPAVAVARFVWHLAGSSDLASITFYEPRAARFSDDGATLSGSNYGARLFGGNGNPNQIEGVISRLRAEPASRRAMAVVWQPEDATRDSRDIPCALAMACYVRSGRLLTLVSMRSNNALRLLPYNLFEFSLLAEMIAAELELPPGPYWHVANSLHIFEEERELAQRLVHDQPGEEHAMSPMPQEKPFAEARKLVDHEQRLRTAFQRGEGAQLPHLLRGAEADLNSYWYQLYLVLALFCAVKKGEVPGLDVRQLLERIPTSLRKPTALAMGISPKATDSEA
jgi:Thymidylate synthase